ncbi:MAG: serine/threonine protein kinase [Desulfobacterales bacterium]|nr:serine/threonine protein kinase [Desulfobacterales bacterium]
MEVFIKGKGNIIKLLDSDYIGEGGEAKVYGKDGIAYKIYHDIQKLIPEAKIKELSLLDNSCIIRPENVLINKNKSYIGFTMRLLPENFVYLPKIFINDFRKRIGFTDQDALSLVEAMKELLIFIHEKNCLVIDGNEFNYLLNDKKLTEPYIIDVNSFQTPSFPATAIMPSIRDWRNIGFSELTDWFSFGIIACQIFIGIHPYKGKHPDYKNDQDILKKRMMDSISIFNPKVSLPKVVRDFNCIPDNYRDWFIQIFEHGDRTPPPTKAGLPTGPSAVIISLKIGTNYFDIKELMKYDDEILYHKSEMGKTVTKTKKKIFINNHEASLEDVLNTEVLFTSQSLYPVFVNIKENSAQIWSPNKEIKYSKIECSEKMICNNTLYLRNQGMLLEIIIKEIGLSLIASVKEVWNIMPKSSKMFAGLIYSDVLGEPFLGIPIPSVDGKSGFANIKIPEIKSFKVVEGKNDNRICVLILYKDDLYYRAIIKFNKDYSEYKIRISHDIGYSSVNFVTLDNGISVLINERNQVEIFSNDFQNDKSNVVQDPDIDESMKLCKEGVKTLFYRADSLYSINIKRS